MKNRIDKESTRTERVFELYILLTQYRGLIPYDTFNDARWGDARTFRRVRDVLNSIWSRLKGTPLFEIVGVDGRPTDRGERFLKVIDQSVYVERAEKLAVFPAIREFMRVLKGTIIDDELTPTYKNLSNGLSNKEKQYLKRMEKKFFYFGKGIKNYSQKADVLDAVYDSLLKDKMLAVTVNDASGKKVERVLCPLTLVMFNGGLYLLSLFEGQKDTEEPYKWRIESFLEARVLRTKDFQYPTHFDPGKYFGEDFGVMRKRNGKKFEVVLEFVNDPQVIRYVQERSFSPNAKTEEANDGKLRLTLTVSDFSEIKSWILSWGSNVRVIKPDTLRQEVKNAAGAITMLYSA